MRTILIKHSPNLLTGTQAWWTVYTEGRIADGLCWDEMLGAFANWRIGNRVNLLGLASPVNLPEWIVVTEVAYNDFAIEHRGKFISRLTRDEALGFVAAYTLTGKQLFHGLQTYEQLKANRFSGLNKPIAGLLTAA